MRNIRDYCRRECSIPCKCAGKSRSVPGKIVDLSFDRALIIQSAPSPRLGSKVVVTVEPEKEKILLEGRVVYVQPQGPFGVKFSGTSNDNLEKLEPVFQGYLKPELEQLRSSSGHHDLMLVK
ncbi:MAG: PilZ domain-containing protein [bacterium]